MSRRPLLHVLGGGPWQTITVRRAQALGCDVLVTDLYPERPAYAFAERHEVIDITDREATLDAARRHHIDGILCDTTDVGVPTAASTTSPRLKAVSDVRTLRQPSSD